MSGSLRRLSMIAGFAAMVSTSTASLAADNSTSWAALSALSSNAAVQDASPARASNGLPSGTGFFSGAVLPIGVIVAAGILAVVLASRGNGQGRGRGFSPS